MKAKNLGNNK